MDDRCEARQAELGALRSSHASVLRAVLAIDAVMFIVEFGGELATGSSALLADSLVYGFSLFVVHRGPVWHARAALSKGVIMAVFGVAVLLEVAFKLRVGAPPEVPGIAAVGLLALAANTLCFALLWRHRADGNGPARRRDQLEVELETFSIGRLSLGRVGATRRASSPSLMGPRCSSNSSSPSMRVRALPTSRNTPKGRSRAHRSASRRPSTTASRSRSSGTSLLRARRVWSPACGSLRCRAPRRQSVAQLAGTQMRCSRARAAVSKNPGSCRLRAIT